MVHVSKVNLVVHVMLAVFLHQFRIVLTDVQLRFDKTSGIVS